MNRYIATSDNKIITTNGRIEPNGYSCIYINNIGEATCIVNNNIPLAAGASWKFENNEYVEIGEITNVRFLNNSENKMILVEFAYYKEV